MARTVVVHCDLCLEEGERTEAEELPPITIEGKRPRVLALCPDHKQDYYDPFVELVDDLAQEYPEDSSDSDEEEAWDDEPEDDEEAEEDSEDQPDEEGEASYDEADDVSEEASEEGDEDEDSDEEEADEEEETDEEADDDPEQIVAESPAMSAVPDEPDTARWDCPVDDCDKSYTASGDNRAEELKRLGNLHLATGHHLDKAARQELLSA